MLVLVAVSSFAHRSKPLHPDGDCIADGRISSLWFTKATFTAFPRHAPQHSCQTKTWKSCQGVSFVQVDQRIHIYIIYIYIFMLHLYTYRYMLSIWICDLFGFHFQIALCIPDLQGPPISPLLGGTKWSAGALGRTCRHGARAAASWGWETCASDRLFGCAKGVSGWFEYDKTMEKNGGNIFPNRNPGSKRVFVSVIGMNEEKEMKFGKLEKWSLGSLFWQAEPPVGAFQKWQRSSSWNFSGSSVPQNFSHLVLV